VIVVGDIALIGSFLHREDLALVALCALVRALDHHREFATLQVYRETIADEAVVVHQLQSFAGDELRGTIEFSSGLAVGQRIEYLIAVNVPPGRRFERCLRGPGADEVSLTSTDLPLVRRVEFETARRGIADLRSA